MKITPDSSLFTALSRFPDPAQVRDGAARRQSAQGGVAGEPGQRSNDPREAIRQEIMRRQKTATRPADGQQVEGRRRADPAQSLGAGQKTGPVQSSASNRPGEADQAFRREVPNTDTKPKFVRMGQFVDITV